MAVFQQIYFDLDGTLCDSYPGIERGFMDALRQLGRTDITEEDLKKLIGIPLTTSLYTFFPDDDATVNRAVELFREYYRTQGMFESVLYPGIDALLATLSETAQLYVATAKPTVYAKQMLEHHKVLQYFTDVRGVTLEGGDNFTKAGAIGDSYAGGMAIMVGDRKQDIDAGKAAGIRSLGVLYGYGQEEEIRNATPTHIAANVAELTQILSGK